MGCICKKPPSQEEGDNLDTGKNDANATGIEEQPLDNAKSQLEEQILPPEEKPAEQKPEDNQERETNVTQQNETKAEDLESSKIVDKSTGGGKKKKSKFLF